MDDPRFAHLAYYQRLVMRIKTQVAAGILPAGTKLPSVRDMAKEQELNPNTVAKAYKQLEQDRVLVVKPGLGSFIAEEQPELGPDQLEAERLRFTAATVAAKAAGVSFAQLRLWLAAQFPGEVHDEING